MATTSIKPAITTSETLALRPASPDLPMASAFLRLPTELRLQIYSYIFFPQAANDLLPDYSKIVRSAQDSFDYERREHGSNRLATTDLTQPAILLRTIDSTQYAQYESACGPHKRTCYSVRGDRFRARTMPTTYHAVNGAHLSATNAAAMLRVSAQLHSEAAPLLYSAYTFDVDTHVEALIPFLRDLTPSARAHVARIRVVKRALPYEKEFDRAEWTAAMCFLADPEEGLSGLRGLELGIVAGRPGPGGWDDVMQYSARDFDIIKEQESMEWMRPLLSLRGLRELKVAAVVEHCPPASNSMAMARFIRFSASVESGFAEFLREQLL